MAELNINKMSPRKRLSRLYSLRAEVAALCAVKCHMSHERIVRAGEFMLPVICRFPEGSYQRIGLCSSEVRAKRLGCSHTSARIKLGDAINELTTGDGESSEQGEFLGRELNWLDNQIHLLDHRKGEAEKILARKEEEISRADDRAGKEVELIEARKAIHEMERTHDEYVEQIGALRDRLVKELDKLIERAGMTRSVDAGMGNNSDGMR